MHFNIDSSDVIYNEDTSFGNLVPVNIMHDGIASKTIFPSRVLAGFNQPVISQIAFVALMVSRALSTPGVTAMYYCIAKNSGSTGGRYWFGYLFGGGPVTSDDFVEAPEAFKVEGARAYNVVVLNDSDTSS